MKTQNNQKNVERNKTMKAQKLIVIVTIVCLLLVASGNAEEATVILDDNNNVIRIENLEVLDIVGNDIHVYDVDFVYDTAFNVYGAGLDFDFSIAADALSAFESVTNALNNNVPVPPGAGPSGTEFFIGNVERASRVGALGGANIDGIWDHCQEGCIAGVAVLDPGDPFTYAKFYR